MLPAGPLVAPSRPPIVRPVSAQADEGAAVRATVSGLSRGLHYIVRFRVAAAPGAARRGCVVSAVERVAGSRRPVRVGLAPGGVWCAGLGVLRVVSSQRGAPAGTSHVRIDPPAGLGQGNLVGHLLLGPTCPVERVDDPCDPVRHPDPTVLVALDASGGEAGRTVTLQDGSFALDLPPGSYILHADAPPSALPRIADTAVVVPAGVTRASPQRVIVRGDTGIR
jgi:hypothetical protein